MERSVAGLKKRYKMMMDRADSSAEREKLAKELEGLLQEQAGLDSAPPPMDLEAQETKRNYNKGGMAPKSKKKFKTCAACPSPSACTAAGKCMKQGYAKGGMVKKYKDGGMVKANCGASVPPNRMAKK